MRFAVQDGYVFLEKDPQTGEPKLTNELREMFLPQWFRDALVGSDPQEITVFEETYLRGVARELTEISDNPQNWMYRGVPVVKSRAKFGDKSVPIREVLLVSAAYSLPIIIAVSALVTGPTGLVLAAKAAGAIGPATASLYNAINTYTPTELDVHTAVVAAMHRNYSRTLKGDGVALEEVEASFEADPKLLRPENLKAVLDDMANEKKRMLIRSVEGGAEVFKPNTF
jgi:hypothetical protein